MNDCENYCCGSVYAVCSVPLVMHILHSNFMHFAFSNCLYCHARDGIVCKWTWKKREIIFFVVLDTIGYSWCAKCCIWLKYGIKFSLVSIRANETEESFEKICNYWIIIFQWPRPDSFIFLIFFSLYVFIQQPSDKPIFSVNWTLRKSFSIKICLIMWALNSIYFMFPVSSASSVDASGIRALCICIFVHSILY